MTRNVHANCKDWWLVSSGKLPADWCHWTSCTIDKSLVQVLAWCTLDVWSCPMSSRSFSHNFAIKLLKYGTSCYVHSAAHAILMNSFHIWHKWSLTWEGVSRTLTFDLDIYIFNVIQPWLEKLPYLAQMITTLRGCVVCNDLWPWPISSRSFSCYFAIKK